MKSNLFKQFKTDTSAEQDGNWFAVQPGVRFLMRRNGGSNSHRVKAANAKYQTPLIKKMQAGTLTDDEQYEIGLKTFIDSCLVGWEGITDENNQPIPFSFENALEVLRPLQDLADTLLRYSSNFENFREDVGNS